VNINVNKERKCYKERNRVKCMRKGRGNKEERQEKLIAINTCRAYSISALAQEKKIIKRQVGKNPPYCKKVLFSLL
jgi:hypothetical protein